MKKCLLIFAILFLASWKERRKTTTMLNGDRQEILKGKVKRLIETGLTRGGGEFLMQYADSIFFDRKGYELMERASFGTWNYQIDYNFSDEDGRKSLELPWPRAIGKRDYEFDGYGHLTELCYYNEDGFFEKNKYDYNSLGQLIGVKTYDKKELIRHKIKLNYGKYEFLSDETWYPFNSDQCSSSTSYKYQAFDKHGNWTKRIGLSKDCKDNSMFYPDTVSRKISYY